MASPLDLQAELASSTTQMQEESPLLALDGVSPHSKYDTNAADDSDEEIGLIVATSSGNLSCDSSMHSHVFSDASTDRISGGDGGEHAFATPNKFFRSTDSSSTITDCQDEKVFYSSKSIKRQTLWQRVDKGALQFALRMAVLLSLSALFVLIKTKDYQFPDGMWVLVSVLFVCWFPSLDAASVIEKIVQRLIGTFLGAFLGLSCGFLSLLLFKTRNEQACFLEVCMFSFNFAIIFAAGQAKVGTVKVIRKFAYATILCVLTFCICMLPFASDNDPKWETGVWRVINVIVGCFLGAVGSIVVCPKSTTDVLHDKAAKQVKMAGDASEAVLSTAADFFAGKIEVNRLADDILETPLESAVEWQFLRSNSLISNASSDISTARADVAKNKFESSYTQMEIARTLARALRIQTTIVVMDGMVRNDADYDFLPSQLAMFHEAGTLIKRMLTVPLHVDRSDAAAKLLFEKLEEARTHIRRMSTAVSTEEMAWEETRHHGLRSFQRDLLKSAGDFGASTRTTGDEAGRGIPKDVTGRHDNTLFFLQLVEHLILRSLRLYQAWKHVEPIQKV